MADRVYPSAKPNTETPKSAVNGDPNLPTAAGGRANHPSFPATKGQLYSRPIYRPQPPSKRMKSRRRFCRTFCCSLVLIILTLLLLAAAAGGIFYALYRPQRPSFSVSSLQLTTFGISASNQLKSKLNIAVTARNPNRKIAFLYDPVSVSLSSNGVDVGNGSFPAFVHYTKNTTVLRATISSSAASWKNSVPLEIDLETKAGIKVGKLKTMKLRIKVYCEGIQIAAPKGKKATAASTMPNSSCKVKLRIKIWKWTF